MRVLFAALLLLIFAGPSPGRGEEAVIRIGSHGGSGTVIATGPGWSLLLSAAHMFEGGDRARPLRLDVPAPSPGGPLPLGGQAVLAVWPQEDLALVRLAVGPLPYVCPVAPAGHRPLRTVSCGYDRMQLPGRGPQVYPARIVSIEGPRTYTRERPWHGRSGGALLDPDAGLLVGVVSGYETGPAPHDRGIYSSHAAVLRLMSQYGGGAPPPSTPQPGPLPGRC